MFWFLIILKIVLYILLFFIGFLILLLCIPFSYSGELRLAEGIRVRCDVGWAWRMVHIALDVNGEENEAAVYLGSRRILRLKTKAGEKAAEAEKGKKEKEEKAERKGRKMPGLRDLTDTSLIHELLAYVKRMLKLLKPRYFHLKGTYGFDDPSLTGMTCGAISMINGCIPNARIDMSPSFTEEVFEVDMAAEGSMRAGILTYETIKMIFKKPIRKILFKRKK